MVRNSIFLLLLLGCTSLDTQAMGSKPIQPHNNVTGEIYRDRYPLANASQKMVGNTGDGFEDLYGTRNFRSTLNGVYYRGGGANAYLKPKPRSNMNPLPNVGLENLCEEGFTKAVYLYTENFETAPITTRCRTFDGRENTLKYEMVNILAYKKEDQRKMLLMILDHIRDSRLGPIYAHCWNGWHASGFVSALTLRQYCGFTPEQAVDYWNKNTDGNNGSNYEGIRRRIREFQPYADLSITAEEKATLCPTPGSLEFSR